MVGLLLWFPHYNTLQLYRYIPSNDSFSMLENHHFIPPIPIRGSLLPVQLQMAVMHSRAACFTSFLMSQVRSATGLTRFTSRYPRKP